MLQHPQSLAPLSKAWKKCRESNRQLVRIYLPLKIIKTGNDSKKIAASINCYTVSMMVEDVKHQQRLASPANWLFGSKKCFSPSITNVNVLLGLA